MESSKASRAVGAHLAAASVEDVNARSKAERFVCTRRCAAIPLPVSVASAFIGLELTRSCRWRLRVFGSIGVGILRRMTIENDNPAPDGLSACCAQMSIGLNLACMSQQDHALEDSQALAAHSLVVSDHTETLGIAITKRWENCLDQFLVAYIGITQGAVGVGAPGSILRDCCLVDHRSAHQRTAQNFLLGDGNAYDPVCATSARLGTAWP